MIKYEQDEMEITEEAIMTGHLVRYTKCPAVPLAENGSPACGLLIPKEKGMISLCPFWRPTELYCECHYPTEQLVINIGA